MSKYKGIEYPFYALRDKPHDVRFTLNTVEIQLSSNDTQWRVLDDRTLPGDYFNRQVQMLNLKYTKVNFNYTCRNLSEILNSKTKWGLDSKAKIFDFTTKEKFKLTCKKIKKIKENLVWVENISYPFKLNTSKININDVYYLTLVYVDNQWYPLEFSFSKHNRIAAYL